MNSKAQKVHPAKQNLQCVWMQAEVVSQKFCKADYNCPNCHYDRVMHGIAEENREMKLSGIIPKGNRGKIVAWHDRMRERPASRRPCVFHMKGKIEFRVCNNDYRCGNCDFAQFFDDQYSVYAVVSPVDAMDIKGFKIPQGYYFHEGHTWVKIEEGGLIRVGIDDFALRLLGPFDRIETPLMGREVKQGRADISLTRNVNKAKVLSPISGVITAINPDLRETGAIANQNPYSEGWVMIVKPDNLRQDIKNLMINHETSDFMSEQVELLYQEIETAAGPMATDGGFLGDDIYGNMPQFDWNRLTEVFLKT